MVSISNKKDKAYKALLKNAYKRKALLYCFSCKLFVRAVGMYKQKKYTNNNPLCNCSGPKYY